MNPQNKTLLILDPSSNHMAWSIMTLKGDEALIIKTGMLYASSSWDLGHRLFYMYQALKFIINYFSVNHIVTEDFVIPHFRQAGVSVIPTINNNLKMLAYEIEQESKEKIEIEFISVPTWRKHLGISSQPKVDKKGFIIRNKKGKEEKDYKIPCRVKVEEVLKFKLPAEVLANTNLKTRKLPHDISDCLGIAVAYAIKLGTPKIKINPKAFENEELIKNLFIMCKKY